VETKLIELWRAEEEARRVWEEAEAARKAKEKAEEQMRIMQATAEAARKAKEEAARLEEQRRIEAGIKRMAHERRSSKELSERSEARMRLLQKLAGDPADAAMLEQVFPYYDYSLPEEVYAPPKKRIEQTKKSTDEELRLLEQDAAQPLMKLHEDDYAKARQKQYQEEQLKRAGQDNLIWLMGEISKEKIEKAKVQHEIPKKAVYPVARPRPVQSQSLTLPMHTPEQTKSLWERDSVTSRDSNNLESRSTGSSGSAKISLAGPLSDSELSPKLTSGRNQSLFSSLETNQSLFSSLETTTDTSHTRDAAPLTPRTPRGPTPRDFTPRTLTSCDYRTGLTSKCYDPPPRRTTSTPRTTYRSLLTMTEKRSFLGSKEKGSLLSPDLAEMLATIADNGSYNSEMGA